MKAALFGFLHNCLAHPLMSLSFEATWSQRFHNWTAKQAWFDSAVTDWLLQPIKEDSTFDPYFNPTPKPTVVWVAPEADPEQCEYIRAQVRLAQQDPCYSILTNFQLSWVKVSPGDIVVAEDGTTDQVEFLRAELDKVWGDDPTHIVVLPFEIVVLPAPPSA